MFLRKYLASSSPNHRKKFRNPARALFSGLGPGCLVAILLLTGCNPSSSRPQVESIEIRGTSRFGPSEFFHGAPGSLVGPLRVQVLGPEIQGIPGRDGSRDPVSGVEVTFRFKYALRIENEYADAVSLPQLLLRLHESPERSADPEPEKREDTDSPETPESAGAPTPESAGPGSTSSDSSLESFLPRFTAPASKRGTQTLITRQPLFDPDDKDLKKPLPPELVELGTQVATVTTDARGFASIDVRLGQYVGEFRVEAEITNQFEQPRTVDFWLISGLELLQQDPLDREGPVGSPSEIAVKVYRNEGRLAVPEKDRAVHFTPVIPDGHEDSLQLEKSKDRTNSDGIAKVDLRHGQRAGQSHLVIELQPTAESPSSRSPVVTYYGQDLRELCLLLLAGVALFIIGLRFLSSGLLTRLSPQLRLATTTFARNNFTGFLGGTAIGATFLSSSTVVTRLMIFANSGLLIAEATAGQILGVHLGKSLLIQLLAFDLVLLLGAPLTAVGTVLAILPGRVNTRAWGNIFLGIGVIILGWQFLLETAEIARQSPGLSHFLETWDPASDLHDGLSSWVTFGLLTFLALLFTAVVGNSSLVVAMGMACVGQGLTSPQTVVALMIGGHLGSCSAVLVRSLGRNREARRVAVLHTLFYVLGSIWLVALTAISPWGRPLTFEVVDWLVPGRFFASNPENIEHHIAMTYTMYHLVNGVVLLALTPVILKLVRRLVPRDPIQDNLKPYRLDASLVDVPSLALEQTTHELTYLIEILRKNIAESYDAFRYRDLNLADQIQRREETVHSLHRELSLYLLQLTNNRLAPRVATRLECLQAATGYLMPIARQGEFLRDLTTMAIEEGIEIPELILKDLADVYQLMMEQFETILNLLAQPSSSLEDKAVKLGERLARSTTRIEHGWFKRARESADSGEAPRDRRGILAEILGRDAYSALVLVSRHLADIAERMRILQKE